jgi:hypothetical protein
MTLCPGGKERMRRLMNIVRAKRFPFQDLITHSFKLAYRARCTERPAWRKVLDAYCERVEAA